MATYRVYFRRHTSIDLYLDVEACNENHATKLANQTTHESDDSLTEIPESYSYDVGPTGEVEKR